MFGCNKCDNYGACVGNVEPNDFLDCHYFNIHEQWIDIAGSNGNYQVSNLGNVKSKKRKGVSKDRLLLGTVNSYGYRDVSIVESTGVYSKKVHRLVFDSFIGISNKDNDVHHMNHDRLDNNIKNLEELTPRDHAIEKSIYYKDSYTSKHTGVYLNKRDGIWVSNIKIDNKCMYLGGFKTEDEAKNSYLKHLMEYENSGSVVLPVRHKAKKQSLYKGVTWSDSNKKWRSGTRVNGKSKYIGYYETEAEAHKAYQEFVSKN